MNDIEILILAIGTASFLAITWQMSVRAGRYHGTYRFFSFESILLLVLLNWHYWFETPFALHQIVSWIALIGSTGLVLAGTRLLISIGKPKGQLENTSVLVTVGIYKYIRHPLYASLLLLGLGAYLKHVTPLTTALAVVNIIALIATAQREEGEMVQKFGIQYEIYRKSTKYFIPFLF